MPSWLWEAISRIADIGGVIALLVLIGSAIGWLIRRLRLGAVALPPAYLITLGIAGACGSLAAGLARLWLGHKDLLTAILVAVGAAGMLAGCAYILLQWYVRRLPPQKAIILVADFQREGTAQDDYHFTGLLLERLRNALTGETKVEVQALKRAVTAQEGSLVARQEGERHKAAIVIWGWYGVPLGGNTAVVSAHFEVLREPKYMPSLRTEEPRFVALAHLESFAFQTQLSKEMAYLAAFTAGMGHYAAMEWGRGVSSFTTALTQTEEPVQALDRSAVYFYRGLAYEEQGQYRWAIADFNRVIALDPNIVAAYNNLGLAYDDLGQHQQAISDFTQAIELKPDYVMAYVNRGVVYDEKGQYEWAIADFAQAIALDPNLAEAYNNRGVVYGEQGKYEQAIADFDKAIELKPNYAEAYSNRGLAHAKQSQYQLAIANYNQAIVLRPDLATVYGNRGLVYKRLGEKAKAIVDFRKVLELSKDAELRRRAGEELKGLG